MTNTTVRKFTSLMEKLLVDLRALDGEANKTKPSKKTSTARVLARMPPAQKKVWPKVHTLLRQGKLDNRAIAKQYPAFKWTNVRSYRSHVTMGSYK